MSIVLVWCSAFGLYLVLAGQVSTSEVCTGAILATLATIWAVLVRRVGSRRFSWTTAHLGPWLRAWAGCLPATLKTGRALAGVLVTGRRIGRPVETPFHFGPLRDEVESGRRATAILAASLAPDIFVVRVESGREEVLLHALVPPKAAPDPRWLA